MYIYVLGILSRWPFLPWIFIAASSEVFVDTDRQAKLLRGDRGMLPCRVQREVNTVTWSKGLTPQTAQTLVIYKHYNNEWSKFGPGYNGGLYDIHVNFSLVIHNVTIQDNGSFFCEILDKVIGQNYWNVTDVLVYGKYRCSSVAITTHFLNNRQCDCIVYISDISLFDIMNCKNCSLSRFVPAV